MSPNGKGPPKASGVPRKENEGEGSQKLVLRTNSCREASIMRGGGDRISYKKWGNREGKRVDTGKEKEEEGSAV